MYTALYRKWRPMTFNDVISQPHITAPLMNQINSGHTAHAYIFTGSRGTGKTTCSKILAKAVNCPNMKNGNPCLECDICKGIESGSLLDVVEIDAASNNGVDNIRELREEASFTPAVCKYRVYIIDEAHMLSEGAFNALLKIMEEPPPHVIFILATTEIQKIPATIISRCQRYDFRRILTEDITDRLMFISQKENINIDKQAAELIAKISDGGMRDALSLLDRCSALTNHITSDSVSEAVGMTDTKHLFDLTDSILQNDAASALRQIDEIHSNMSDLIMLCNELISHFRNLLIAKTVTKPGSLIIAPQNDIDKIIIQSDRTNLNFITEILCILQDTLVRMKRSAAKRVELETAIIKITALNLSRSDSDKIQNLESKIYKLEQAVASGTGISRTNSKTDSVQPTPPKSAEKIDYSKFTQLDSFDEIIDNLKQIDPPLAGTLYGAKAYTYEDIMLIVTEKNLFAELIKQPMSAAHFSEAVYKLTDKHYRFKIKSSMKISKEKQTVKNPLDELAETARQLGTQVNIKE